MVKDQQGEMVKQVLAKDHTQKSDTSHVVEAPPASPPPPKDPIKNEHTDVKDEAAKHTIAEDMNAWEEKQHAI